MIQCGRVFLLLGNTFRLTLNKVKKDVCVIPPVENHCCNLSGQPALQRPVLDLTINWSRF